MNIFGEDGPEFLGNLVSGVDEKKLEIRK